MSSICNYLNNSVRTATQWVADRAGQVGSRLRSELFVRLAPRVVIVWSILAAVSSVGICMWDTSPIIKGVLFGVVSERSYSVIRQLREWRTEWQDMVPQMRRSLAFIQSSCYTQWIPEHQQINQEINEILRRGLPLHP